MVLSTISLAFPPAYPRCFSAIFRPMGSCRFDPEKDQPLVRTKQRHRDRTARWVCMEPPAQFRDPVRIWNRVRSHFFIPGDGCFGEGTGTDVLLLRNRWEHGHTGLRLRAGYPDRPGLPTGIAAADCQALFVPDAAGATFDERSGFDCIRPEAEAPDGSSVEPHDRTSVAAGFCCTS